MPSLPTLSGRDVVKAFTGDGWQMARQRGSHADPLLGFTGFREITTIRI